MSDLKDEEQGFIKIWKDNNLKYNNSVTLLKIQKIPNIFEDDKDINYEKLFNS